MAPKRGGTIIPDIPQEMENVQVKAEELPELKKSPKTIAAIQWVYNNPLQAEGIPVYCGRCKELGWKWNKK